MKTKLAIEKGYNSRFLKFLIGSFIGIFVFIIPVPFEGAFNIPVGILAEKLVGPYLPYLLTYVMLASVLISLWAKTFNVAIIMKNKLLCDVFYDVTPTWLFMRILGTIFAFMTLYEIGPGFVYHEDTGALMLYSLLKSIGTIFLVSSVLLPFMLNFGAMEFIGTIFRPLFRPLFTLPGRSAIDCVASFIGPAGLGVAITAKQYEDGFYTGREAAVIAVCWSAVSLPFNLVVADFLGFLDMFTLWYGVVILVCTILAIVTARLYPLRGIPDEYYPPVGKRIDENIPEGVTLFQIAIEKGTATASTVTLNSFVSDAISTLMQFWFGVFPVIMCIGTLALIVAEFTPIMHYMGYPFAYMLSLMGIPAAFEAAPGTVAGFFEMFLSPILVAGIEYDITRFVVGLLACVQLVFLSEVGSVTIASKIPLNFKDILVVFLIRTVIALPILALIGHMVFG